MRAILAVSLSLVLGGCSTSAAPSAAASAQAAITSPAPSEAPTSDADRPVERLPPRAVAEIAAPLRDAAVEGRDPFRAYPSAPPITPPDARPRKARRVPVDQLKLVALVTRTTTPRAMLVDPAGKGWIVTQGELVGSPEPLGGDGQRMASFRVDRIREGEIVLVREDAAGTPDGTRVLALPRDAVLSADD